MTREEDLVYRLGVEVATAQTVDGIVAWLESQAELEGAHAPAVLRAVRGIRRGDWRRG